MQNQYKDYANTAKALLVAQTEAGNQQFVHFARIYTFERLATRLVEIARDANELHDYKIRFDALRSRAQLYLLGDNVPREYVTNLRLLETIENNIREKIRAY